MNRHWWHRLTPSRGHRRRMAAEPGEAAALLGRAEHIADPGKVRAWLRGQTVLVTGAGGSIGAELCRQCALHGARRLLLVEIDELALLQVQERLHAAFPGLESVAVLGDCGDPAVLAHALGQGRVRVPGRRQGGGGRHQRWFRAGWRQDVCMGGGYGFLP